MSAYEELLITTTIACFSYCNQICFISIFLFLCIVTSTNELQIAVRNEIDIKFIKLLPQLGWRFRKKSYIVACKDDSKKEYLLQWVPFGPDKYLEDDELCAILKSFISLQVFYAIYSVNYVNISGAIRHNLLAGLVILYLL